MDKTSEWLALLSGNVSPEDAESLLSRSAAELEAFLQTNPQANELLFTLLEKRLAVKIDQRTWEVINNALNNYLGENGAFLFRWVVADEQGARLAELEKHASENVTSLFRTILALYGPELKNTVYLGGVPPNDWRNLRRDIHYDVYNKRYLMSVRITKNNGEEMLIEASPNSFLGLAAFFVGTLKSVPSADVFGRKQVEDFLSITREALSVLRPEVEPVSEAALESVGGRPREESARSG